MPEQAPRDMAICASCILQTDLLIISDLLVDERFVNNPLVTAEPKIRFYAGAPLITPQGLAIGALCVKDYIPRELNATQQECLTLLSHQVMRQIEMRVHLLAISQRMFNCMNMMFD